MARISLSLLLVATAIAYWSGMGGGFVFDDYPNVVENVGLHVSSLNWRELLAASTSSPASNLPRPLAMLSFAINYYFTGLDPVPMKVTNLCIHLLNTVLVYVLVRRLVQCLGTANKTQKASFALVVSALWALHPINVTPVLFVVQRMESLAHTFVFFGLLLYVIGRSRQLESRPFGWHLVLSGTVGCTVLGVLVKESAALLPLFAFLVELTIFRAREPDPKISRGLRYYFLVTLWIPATLGAAWLTHKAIFLDAFAGREFTLAARLLTEPRVIVDYLNWILTPNLADFGLYHDDYRVSKGLFEPPSTILAIFGLGALTWLAFKLIRARPLYSLGIFWFLSAHALTATVVPLELAFEHRNYFSSLGVILAFSDILILFRPVSSFSRTRYALALGIIAFLWTETFLRNQEWKNPVSFAVAEAAKSPNSPRATYYLGWILANATGNDRKSPLIGPAFEALDRARHVPNNNILPDQAALILASRAGLPLNPEWWRHMQDRLSTRPIGPQETGALAGLVKCTLELGCRFSPDDMLATFGAALSQGDHPEVLSIYANYALNALGDDKLALALWRKAGSMNPAEPQYLVSEIKLLIEIGEYKDAQTKINLLRNMGRFRQYEKAATELELRMDSRKGSVPKRRRFTSSIIEVSPSKAE